MPRKRLLAILACTLAFALPAAAAADSSAETFVKDRQSQLTKILKRGKSSKNDKKIQKIFDTMIDYRSLAKQSLKSYWDERSAEERDSFQCVLKQLVQNAYRRNLDKTIDYAVTFHGTVKADRGILVKTVAENKKNPREEPLSIDYVVSRSGGEFHVVDIVTEGSSLVNNYRSQFRRIIKKHGFDDLIGRMKKKLKKDGTPVSCG